MNTTTCQICNQQLNTKITFPICGQNVMNPVTCPYNLTINTPTQAKSANTDWWTYKKTLTVECIDGKLKCPFTHTPCVVDDTAAFNSCTCCMHSPYNTLPYQKVISINDRKMLILTQYANGAEIKKIACVPDSWGLWVKTDNGDIEISNVDVVDFKMFNRNIFFTGNKESIEG